MYQGSTPDHTFKLPYPVELTEEVEVTYAQRDIVILRKLKHHCELDEHSVTVSLTQEDTFLFEKDVPVRVQLRVKDTSGKVHPSEIFIVSCEECLSKEVL